MSKPRLLLIGASHWHVPLYVEAFRRRFEIVGVTDRQADRARSIGADLGVPAGDRVAELVDSTRPDLAAVFSRHDDMEEVGGVLADRGIPFMLEKPGAIGLPALRRLRERTRAAGVPVAVPLVHRWAPFVEPLAAPGRPVHFSASYIVGPPSRYIDVGNEWMLDPESSGGGALTNLGVHLVDLFTQLVDSPVSDVRGLVGSPLHGLGIEDTASMLLRAANGATATIEVGYGYPIAPAKRAARFAVASKGGFVAVDADGRVTTTRTDGEVEVTHASVDSDPLFAPFVDRVADSLARGFDTVPGIDDLVTAMTVVAKAYANASGRGDDEVGATWAS
ncbi:MAG: Gfo/Idh/MocA family oxidoreductase [Actinomycetota bacterium]|nr:Gfo/Idh/MocA family oxidoreductase [Actinomycetota bacterium]